MPFYEIFHIFIGQPLIKYMELRKICHNTSFPWPIQENMGQKKLVCWHLLRSVAKSKMPRKNLIRAENCFFRNFWLPLPDSFLDGKLTLNCFHPILAVREKCPNTELFLVRIFLHSDRIRRDTSYLSVFSPNAGKFGPELTPYLNIFHGVWDSLKISQFPKIVSLKS